MSDIADIDQQADYDVRLGQLLSAGIGLWDVLHLCERPGSLDSAIVRETMEPNDFNQFFAAYPAITRVCLNGAKAAQVFQRHVAPTLRAPIDSVALPSTSPANAAIAYDAKLRAWRSAVEVG